MQTIFLSNILYYLGYSNAEAAACALQVTNKFGLEYQKSVKECGSIEEAILKSIQVINENKTELDNITVFDFKKEDIATEVTEKINGTSYSILKELYDKCITENTMNIFYESLDTTLSNPAILADSFRSMDIECSKDVYIDIDLDQIENLFMLILSDDKCYEQYDISIAKLVTNLKATASTITGADILKAFMLPLYEYIDLDLDPSKQDTSKIKNLFSAIDELSSNSKIMLSKWLKSQGTSDTTSKNYVRYKRYVSICCQFLTLQYYAGELEDSKLGTRVLAIFYTAFSEYPTMSHEEFYNDAINEHIESRETLNAELRYWRQDRTKQSQTTISDPSHYLMKSYRSFISYPFLLQAGIKSDILEKDAAVQMRSSINNEIQWAMTHGQQYVIPYLILRVQRENILQDTLSMIFHFEDKDFKKPLKVIFDNEDGVDAGGVRKEYYQLMLKQLLDPSFGMFQYYPETRLLWFNPNGLDLVTPDEYKLIGTLLGIAIFNSIILDLPFPSYLYKKLKRNRPNLSTLSDLESIQPLLAKSLKFLLDYDKDDIEDVFDFTFQINYKDVFECVQTVDLKPNGANTKVNQQNKHEYVNLYIQYIMDVSIDPQFKAFEVGFRKVIDGFSMNLFEAKELELLICGSHTLDFDELERGSVYDDGYDENSQAIYNFWEIVKSYDETEKKLFLKFVSGSDRSPIEGLSKLKLVISKNGDDNSRLPSAHTCFNHLLLPEYSSIDIMREKLNYAITQAEGFGLR